VRQDVTHPEYKGESKAAAVESYERLKGLVETVLGTKLERDGEGGVLLFGRPIAQAGLSEGQSVLLQFCVGLHAQGGALNDTILVMDEPENHLHPEVVIGVIERVVKQLGGGQLWIATHSVALISQFEPDQVWYMENGSVSQAGSTPEKVLYGLLGGEEKAQKLASFTDLPASYAANRFALQCLVSPGTVGPKDDDPQMEQVRMALEEGGVQRVLDFGAGQGRLASSLCEALGRSEGKVPAGFEYVAYDADTKDEDVCLAAIGRLYGEAAGRWFSDLHPLLDAKGEGYFDAVVMCNVLHEIDPVDWLKLFDARGPLVRLMKEDGYLLVVEDERMPVGERAYAKGFLVLGTDELRELFCVRTDEEGFKSNSQRDGRLKAHRIPRAVLGRMSDASRKKVLELVKRRAEDKVKELRTQKASYRNGMLHAFWVQQLANATLALGELGR